MKAIGALAMLAIGCTAAPSNTPLTAPDLVLRNVTVIDVEAGEAQGPRTISIREGHIVAIDAQPPADFAAATQVIDGDGLFVMPGLWDAHAHLSYWGEDALDRLVGHGVTTIRELGGDPDEIESWKTAIDAGDRVGPAMYWCGPFFEGPDGEDEYRWKVSSPEEASARAGQLLDRGVDFLKIQPQIGRAEVAGLIAAARERGSSVVGHVPAGMTAIEAASLGLRSIEHLSPYTGLTDEELDATIAALLQHGTWVSPALFSMVAQVQAGGTARTDSEPVQRAYAIVRRLHAAGVPMLVGANFAYRDWPHQPGSALHGEMEVLVEAGIPAAEVLRMATTGNAAFLGVDVSEIAVIPGARADLVLLTGNPLEEIEATRAISGVVLRGAYLDALQARALRLEGSLPQ